MTGKYLSFTFWLEYKLWDGRVAIFPMRTYNFEIKEKTCRYMDKSIFIYISICFKNSESFVLFLSKGSPIVPSSGILLFPILSTFSSILSSLSPNRVPGYSVAIRTVGNFEGWCGKYQILLLCANIRRQYGMV